MSTSPISFSGLASGLDTTGIINQLMSIEAAPQTAIKNRVATEQTQVSALQALNSTLAAISTSSDSFRTGSTWTQLTATSSYPAVSVSATSAAQQGALSLTVNSVATAARLGFSTPAALTDVVVAPPGSSLDVGLADGSTVAVAVGDGTLASVITALNGLKDANGKALLSASAVTAGNGQVRLLVSAAQTGAGSLSIAPTAGGTLLGGATSVAGTDASIDLGAGITVTQSSNTFTSLLPGLTVTLGAGTAIGQQVQVDVADDGSSRANGVKQFVSQINDLISQVAIQTKYGTNGVGGGPLAGNQDLPGVVNALRMTIFPTDGTTLAAYGIDLDRDGNLTFDATKFEAAYQADPSGVQAAFTGSDGWVSRVEKAADTASLPSSGTLSAAIKSMNDQIASQNDEIAAWSDRLAVKQQSLEHIYTNLETQLSKLQAQQSWLTNALSSLDAGWSQNSKG
ncbi:MAG TPA: flagellar filament capping protein FliD [Nocardioides sp.]|nr:flagellar filament capping protein FliD [Nocardioides sp.]